MKNFLKTVISQYYNSPTIMAIVASMDAWLDPQADLDAIYRNIWDIDTAVGTGLDVWGRIVNIDRMLTIPASETYFGFNEASPDFYPFGEGVFYDPTATDTETYALSDEAYRTLILCKALANITATVAPVTNQLLQALFAGRGRCYVNDMGNMGMRYTFEFALTDYEYAVITQSGALPRPAGVRSSILASPLPLFGFSEAGLDSAAPFGEGVFVPPTGISYISEGPGFVAPFNALTDESGTMVLDENDAFIDDGR